MCIRIQVRGFACVHVHACDRIMDTHKDQSGYDDMAYVMNHNIDVDEDDHPAKRMQTACWQAWNCNCGIATVENKRGYPIGTLVAESPAGSPAGLTI